MKLAETKPEVASIRLENILFATDFSTASVAALPFVTAVARRYGSKVYLAHVVSTEPYPMLSPEAIMDVLEQLTENTGCQLMALCESEQFKGIPCETVLEQNIPQPALVHTVLLRRISSTNP